MSENSGASVLCEVFTPGCPESFRGASANRLLEKKGDNAPAYKLLNEIAAELGRMDWSGKLNTTDDFIAYAVNTDLADLQKNLKQSVPADRLKKLKAAKML